MHGFISESTSKISDGLWSATKLMLLSLVAILFPQLIERQFSFPFRLPYLILLMVVGIFYLFRSLVSRNPDTQKAMNGMVAGVLFWYAVRYSGLPEDWEFFKTGGYLLWLGSAILVFLLWSRVLPIGMRFTLLVLMAHWLGRLLILSLPSMTGAGFSKWLGIGSVRLLGIIGFFISLWYIIVRSANPLQRRYAAVGLYASFLLLFMLF